MNSGWRSYALLLWVGFFWAGVGCEKNVRPEFAVTNPAAPGTLHPIVVREARRAPRVTATLGTVVSSEPDGSETKETGIPCGTCHRTREPNLDARSAADLDEFHQGLAYAHGGQTCVSCHHPEEYDSLRRADGKRLPYRDTLALCSQCHGTQARDYEHGAHGGGEGYWDRRRGSPIRNQCTHCHDPHAPAYPSMQPTFKPRDRFLLPSDRKEVHG